MRQHREGIDSHTESDYSASGMGILYQLAGITLQARVTVGRQSFLFLVQFTFYCIISDAVLLVALHAVCTSDRRDRPLFIFPFFHCVCSFQRLCTVAAHELYSGKGKKSSLETLSVIGRRKMVIWQRFT